MVRGRHRTTVDPEDCQVCKSQALEPTLSEAYVAGYIAGLHSMSFGERSDEKACKKHSDMLKEAVLKYTGKAVL